MSEYRLELPFSEQDWQRVVQRLGLSPREAQVAQGILADHKRRRIAADLGIAERTVNCHVERLYARLQVQSTNGLWTRVIAALQAFQR